MDTYADVARFAALHGVTVGKRGRLLTLDWQRQRSFVVQHRPSDRTELGRFHADRDVIAVATAAQKSGSLRSWTIAGVHPVVTDPPPSKWSTLSYGFALKEDRNAEEELQAGGDRRQAAAG
jgi:hypothetical protein